MHHLPALSPLLPWLLLLGSCGSPPKPPAVDESQKRPVNSAMAVELQACKHDLANNRILATEFERSAESAAAALRHVAARQEAISALMAQASMPRPNSIFTIRFDFASTRFSIPDEMSVALLDEAKQAPLVVLRGRTDGTIDSLAESRIARQRANAVQAYLIAGGVDPTRIRATYQPVGDHATDNTADSGRAMNRRVEIELYRSAPVPVGAAAAPSPSPSLP